MENSFYQDFASISAKEQVEQIIQDIGGEQHLEKISWLTPEGFQLQPIYHRKEDKPNSPFTATKTPWKLGQYIQFAALETTLDRINHAIANEVEVLYLDVGNFEHIIPKVAEVVKDKSIEVFFFFTTSPKNDVLYALQQLTNVCIFYDVFGQYASKGEWIENEEKDLLQLKELNQQLTSPTFFVDASIYANAGGNTIQQIGYTLLHLNEYLTHLEHLKNHNAVNFTIKIAQGGTYFMEIAKSIALRTLVNTIVKEYDFPISIQIIAEPQQRNKSRVDYNTNLLRSSTEMMSAILGDADIVMNHPYDLRFNLPNLFSDRLARNQLLILKHESFFDRLPNVTQGSYFIEALVEDIKRSSWALFLKHEAFGGWLCQIQNNTIQNEIYHAREKEQSRIEQGLNTVVGVNKYFDETALSASEIKRKVIKESTSILPIQLVYSTA